MFHPEMKSVICFSQLYSGNYFIYSYRLFTPGENILNLSFIIKVSIFYYRIYSKLYKIYIHILNIFNIQNSDLISYSFNVKFIKTTGNILNQGQVH